MRNVEIIKLFIYSCVLQGAGIDYMANFVLVLIILFEKRNIQSF